MVEGGKAKKNKVSNNNNKNKSKANINKESKKNKESKENKFMQAKNNALKNNLESFEYTNNNGEKKTYERFKMKSGMVAYRTKK